MSVISHRSGTPDHGYYAIPKAFWAQFDAAYLKFWERRGLPVPTGNNPLTNDFLFGIGKRKPKKQ